VRLESPGSLLFIPGTSAQLMQVTLPEPAVCSVYFQASMTTSDPGNTLQLLSVNLNEGVGRVTVIREVTFLSQPAINSPLEFTLPFVPVNALNVDVLVTGSFLTGSGPQTIDVDMTMILSPITRIPQKEQKLTFGMAMPGEADALDDELRSELEAEGPTAAATVMHAHGEAHEDDEPEPDDQVERVPPWVMLLIKQLERRLGRPPSLPELRRAVQRRQARTARRRSRAR
jgi:hypothetical protein